MIEKIINLSVIAREEKMKTKVKILKNNRVHINIKGFNMMPYPDDDQKKNLEFVARCLESKNRLILILRHISRFDIPDKRLMVLNHGIKIEKLKICVEKFNGDQAHYLRAFNEAAEQSIWTIGNNVSSSIIQLMSNKKTEIEVIYGIDN
jgi:hypothetical protein